jgi:hypothetical protein
MAYYKVCKVCDGKINLINEKDASTTKWYLSTIHKKRGYVERQEQVISTTNNFKSLKDTYKELYGEKELPKIEDKTETDEEESDNESNS